MSCASRTYPMPHTKRGSLCMRSRAAAASALRPEAAASCPPARAPPCARRTARSQGKGLLYMHAQPCLPSHSLCAHLKRFWRNDACFLAEKGKDFHAEAPPSSRMPHQRCFFKLWQAEMTQLTSTAAVTISAGRAGASSASHGCQICTST